jgi:hypothetical protein
MGDIGEDLLAQLAPRPPHERETRTDLGRMSWLDGRLVVWPVPFAASSA